MKLLNKPGLQANPEYFKRNVMLILFPTLNLKRGVEHSGLQTAHILMSDFLSLFENLPKILN